MGVMESKGVLKSKTVLGALLTIAPLLDQVLSGVGITDGPTVEPMIANATGIFGAIIAIIGRVQASTRIRGIF